MCQPGLFTHPLLALQVAIKRIPQLFSNPVDVKRLLRELYILRHVDHPCVVDLIDIVKPENSESFDDL